MNVQYLSKAMLDYSETSENVYLTFNQHIELKNKKFEILVHLTFKAIRGPKSQGHSSWYNALAPRPGEIVTGSCIFVIRLHMHKFITIRTLLSLGEHENATVNSSFQCT